jgi:DNA-binding NarL/FixJ family response regulator
MGAGAAASGSRAGVSVVVVEDWWQPRQALIQMLSGGAGIGQVQSLSAGGPRPVADVVLVAADPAVVRWARRRWAPAGVLAYGEHTQAAAVLAAGAAGFLLAPTAAAPQDEVPGPDGDPVVITTLDRQLLHALANGQNLQQIRIGRTRPSPRTVRRHLRRLYTKLGASNHTSAVAAGFRAGLLT